MCKGALAEASRVGARGDERSRERATRRARRPRRSRRAAHRRLPIPPGVSGSAGVSTCGNLRSVPQRSKLLDFHRRARSSSGSHGASRPRPARRGSRRGSRRAAMAGGGGGEGRPTLVSRRFVVLTALAMAAGLVIIALAVFFVPHARVRRDYAPAACTEIAAVPSCALECRIANVTAPEFPAGASALLARDGIGRAPCESAVECGGGAFACRFKVVATAPEVVLAVRKEPGAFSLGFVVFMALAAVVLALLCVWLCADFMRYCGLKSEHKLGAVVFLPPGIELFEVTRAARWRWPNVATRGLDFASVVTERPDQFYVTVRRVLGHACKPEMRGVIFVVKANGRTDEQVLEAVPQDWFRVLVLPPLEVITSQFTAPAAEEAGAEPDTPPAAGADVNPGSVTLPVEVQQPDLMRRPAGLGAGFQERNRLLEAETAYRELTRLSNEDAGLFDHVHTSMKAKDLTNYPRLVRDICGPVIGLRTASLAWSMRVRRTVHGIGSSILRLVMCVREGDGKGADGGVQESSFEARGVLPSSPVQARTPGPSLPQSS